jgi:hypothetical protein
MSYELRQTTILEAEIEVLRDRLTKLKEENKELRMKLKQNYIDGGKAGNNAAKGIEFLTYEEYSLQNNQNGNK